MLEVLKLSIISTYPMAKLNCLLMALVLAGYRKTETAPAVSSPESVHCQMLQSSPAKCSYLFFVCHSGNIPTSKQFPPPPPPPTDRRREKIRVLTLSSLTHPEGVARQTLSVLVVFHLPAEVLDGPGEAEVGVLPGSGVAPSRGLHGRLLYLTTGTPLVSSSIEQE